jgi:hypothetical protein
MFYKNTLECVEDILKQILKDARQGGAVLCWRSPAQKTRGFEVDTEKRQKNVQTISQRKEHAKPKVRHSTFNSKSSLEQAGGTQRRLP